MKRQRQRNDRNRRQQTLQDITIQQRPLAGPENQIARVFTDVSLSKNIGNS